MHSSSLSPNEEQSRSHRRTGKRRRILHSLADRVSPGSGQNGHRRRFSSTNCPSGCSGYVAETFDFAGHGRVSR